MVRACLALLAAFCCGNAFADTATVYATGKTTATDGGPGNPADGQFDALRTTSPAIVGLSEGPDAVASRALYEFVLPEEVMSPGATIHSVTITVGIASELLIRSHTASVYAVARDIHDSEVTLAEFTGGDLVATYPVIHDRPVPYMQFQIPFWLQSAVGTAHSRIRLVLATDEPGTELQYPTHVATTMDIEYSPAVGANAPALQIQAPANDSVYLDGDPVPLAAQATDAEDGNISGSIVWHSLWLDPIDYGANTSAYLPVGTHLIQAEVTDSHGNTTAQQRRVKVVPFTNTPPTISITSPLDGADLLPISDPGTHFIATANDADQGSLDSAIEWWVNNENTGEPKYLGKGSDLATFLSPGWHQVTARVSDARGAVAEKTINVRFAPPPPPPSYCTAKGTSVSREWIGGVRVNGLTSTTGANGGYVNLAAPVFQIQAGVPTTLALTPKFNGTAIDEQWGIWVDFNQNQVFDNLEYIASGSGTGTVNKTIMLPTSMLNGPTRLRVVMRNGGAPSACGTFSRGEVEDYTVNISGGTSPPTPPAPPPTTAYCSSRGLFNEHRWIWRVNVNGEYKESTHDQGYSDFTSTTPFVLRRGVTNNLNVYFQDDFNGYPDGWGVWIDYNRDLKFAADERLNYQGGRLQFPLGPNVPTGLTRMRIQMGFQDALLGSCHTYFAGETEDYAVQVQ